MRAVAVASAAAALLATVRPATAKTITLSNTALPKDTDGNLLLTGEATLLAKDGVYYAYFNDWGGCPGVDCCPSSHGCAACCFTAAPYTDPCVYTNNHSVVVYSTPDFETWTYLGVALNTSAREVGIEFRPQVVFNGSHYVMWYEDRWPSGKQDGYAVAVSTTPQGPFATIANSVKLPGAGRVGDYDVFVDPKDGAAYHIRTGLSIVKLGADMSSGSSTYVDVPNGGVEGAWPHIGGGEQAGGGGEGASFYQPPRERRSHTSAPAGPSMFERNGVYYLLAGLGCCACRGGSNVVVYTAPSPLGPFTLQGDIGSNHTDGHVFDAHSPYNYVRTGAGSH